MKIQTDSQQLLERNMQTLSNVVLGTQIIKKKKQLKRVLVVAMWDSWVYILTMDSENIVGNAKETLLARTENMLYLLHSFMKTQPLRKQMEITIPEW